MQAAQGGYQGGVAYIYIYIYIASITQPYPTAFPMALSPSNPGNAEAFVCQGWLLALGKRRGFRGHMFAGNWWSYPQIDGGNSAIPRIQFWDSDVSYLVEGWATPLKNMKVSWDYDIPIYGQIKNVPNHQPVILFGVNLWVCCLMEEQASKKPAVRTTNCACEMDGTYTSKYQKVHAGWGPPVLSWFINHYNPH